MWARTIWLETGMKRKRETSKQIRTEPDKLLFMVREFCLFGINPLKKQTSQSSNKERSISATRAGTQPSLCFISVFYYQEVDL